MSKQTAAADVPRTIHISTFIDDHEISLFQWRVVGLCALIAIIDGFDTQAIAFVAPVIVQEFRIAPVEMGGLFSASLIGLMIGAFLFSPLADKIGRKPVILISCFVMGFFSLLMVVAGSTGEIVVYRFLTGLGLGGAMPNLNTLTSEFAPARRRALLMTIMFVGYPLGAVMGGLVSAEIIAVYGWRSVFLLGGIVPIVLALALIFVLPESIRFLAVRGGRGPMVGALLARIDPAFTARGSDVYVASESADENASIRTLFTDGRGLGTALIWLICFANLLMMYTLLSWLPSVMQLAGLALDQAILTTVTFNLGGLIGGLVLAVSIDRFGPYKALALTFAGCAVFVFAIGAAIGSLILLFIIVFAAGATVMGVQFGVNALTAGYYPTMARATGLGWSLAVGRIGAIIGPVVLGGALARDWSLPSIFAAIAAPALVSLGAILTLAWVTRRVRSRPGKR